MHNSDEPQGLCPDTPLQKSRSPTSVLECEGVRDRQPGKEQQAPSCHELYHVDQVDKLTDSATRAMLV